MSTPLARYQADLARPDIRPDPAQEQAVHHLERLYQALLAQPPAGRWTRWLRRRRPPVRGLYLWGGTGRGKTWLVDSFHDCLPFTAKRRIHFHAFMGEVHERLRVLPRTPDPLQVIARGLAREIRVLCLDEFQVQDIADAMLLGGLLKALFEQGVTLVATSNLPIDELYMDGLQRDRFLFAIELLKRHTESVHLAGETDFRCALLDAAGTYHVCTGEAAEALMEAQLAQLAPVEATRDAVLRLGQRAVPAVALADDVAWVRFAELCERPLWAGDYLELARRCHTLLLSDVPALDEDRDDAAKRFMHLVDALYDHGVKLVLAAAVPVARLYQGRYLAFPFQRTVSRLAEMGSHAYLARPHRLRGSGRAQRKTAP